VTGGSVIANLAIGGPRGAGVSEGLGMGGGFFIVSGGAVSISRTTHVFGNFASTSGGDFSGPFHLF
jgi:hypothetical protein